LYYIILYCIVLYYIVYIIYYIILCYILLYYIILYYTIYIYVHTICILYIYMYIYIQIHSHYFQVSIATVSTYLSPRISSCTPIFPPDGTKLNGGGVCWRDWTLIKRKLWKKQQSLGTKLSPRCSIYLQFISIYDHFISFWFFLFPKVAVEWHSTNQPSSRKRTSMVIYGLGGRGSWGWLSQWRGTLIFLVEYHKDILLAYFHLTQNVFMMDWTNSRSNNVAWMNIYIYMHIYICTRI